MRKLGITICLFFCMHFPPNSAVGQTIHGPLGINLQIDGSKRFQQIDGIGVNANTRSWNGKELEPALNILLDSMHASIWRVIVESVEKWEDVNDNDDPFTFNWDYYNKLYETPKFRKAWEMIAYLNKHGITDNLMINFMGFAPQWMGIKVIEPKYEDEFVEMIVSFFYYAIKTRHLKIGLIAPTNESDWYDYSEGPHLNGRQLARIIRKMIDRMEGLGIMGNIRIVGPDVVVFDNATKSFIPALMEDPVIWSKMAHLSFHSYGGYEHDIKGFIEKSPYPKTTFWMSEWNAWCAGCDDGKMGEYNYEFASKSVKYLIEFLQHGATACLAWEGYDSYYEHHAPSLFSYWGILGYNPGSKTYTPRKNLAAISQVSRFVAPGSWRIAVSDPGDSLTVLAFYDTVSHRVNIVGINSSKSPVKINGTLTNLPGINRFEMYYTNDAEDLHKVADEVVVGGKSLLITIPADCIFTLTGIAAGSKKASSLNPNPEPPDWYTGDIHVHKNCGDGTGILAETDLTAMMEPNNIAVISVLADMGNGEVKDSKEDLPKVNGMDAPQSKPGRIVHWDAEWHWDATYSNFSNQALGGHLVLLGLKEAHQIWDESAYKILEWGKKEKAISGFCHLQYLNDSVQNELNCCIPIEFPVEAALGTIDFVSEDVYGTTSPNNGNYNSEAAINAYYKLLNCGFRLGLAAGTDYPCNGLEPLGTLLTYVNVKDKKLTYRKWIEGIKNGKTVVARNGHKEFIDMKVNGKYMPGDDIKFNNKGTVTLEVKWTTSDELTGRIELVSNGIVVASQPGTAKPGEPVILKATKDFTESSWICARRMDEKGHQTHTAPIYITVNKKPVRASAENAQYFINWIDNLLKNTDPGGKWNHYFTHGLETVQNRYRKARDIYKRIITEAQMIKKSE